MSMHCKETIASHLSQNVLPLSQNVHPLSQNVLQRATARFIFRPSSVPKMHIKPYITQATLNTVRTWDSKNPPSIRIFSGSSNPLLAEEIAASLRLNVGLMTVDPFVEGGDVYLVQSLCEPISQKQLMQMIDACVKGGAKRVTAVIPYFGLDEEFNTKKILANVIGGADGVITCEVARQKLMVDYLDYKGISGPDVVVVSACNRDSAVIKAAAFAEQLHSPLAVVHKEMLGQKFYGMNFAGNVRSKRVLLIADAIHTGETIAGAADFLRREGAREVYACSPHGAFCSPAMQTLSSGVFKEVIVTDTIPVADKHFPQLTILPLAEVFGKAILDLHKEFRGDM